MNSYTKVNQTITLSLTLEDEKWAKETTLKDDNTFGIQTFGSWDDEKDDRWTGKIGERGVLRYLPTLAFSPKTDSQFDFFYKDKKLEIKTHGERKLSDEEYKIGLDCHFLLIREKQFKRIEANIYVFCFYEIYKRKLHILGWISKEDIEKKGIHYQRGKMLSSPGYERCLTLKDDNILVSHEDINDMELL